MRRAPGKGVKKVEFTQIEVEKNGEVTVIRFNRLTTPNDVMPAGLFTLRMPFMFIVAALTGDLFDQVEYTGPYFNRIIELKAELRHMP